MSITKTQLHSLLNAPARVFANDGFCLADKAKVVSPPSGEDIPVILHLPRGAANFHYIKPNLEQASLCIEQNIVHFNLHGSYDQWTYDKPVDEQTRAYLK